jgi:hypothetical protein
MKLLRVFCLNITGSTSSLIFYESFMMMMWPSVSQLIRSSCEWL